MSEQNTEFDINQPFVTQEQKFKYWEESKAHIKEANKRIAELEGEVAELQRDRDEWKDSTISANRRFEIAENDVYKYQVETANMSLEIMQLQKNNHDLREALEKAMNDEAGWYEIAKQALSATPAESLQAFKNSVIEKIINIIKSEIDKFNNVDSLLYIIEILDNMKVNHETTKTP